MRDGFSDVLLGLSIAEEVRDFEVSTPAAAPPVETQQDAFTMKALENKPAAPVDFGLMGSKPMQAGLAAVEKSDGKVVPMAAEKVDPQPDLLGLPPLPEEKSPEPPCQTCGGYGVNPADETMDCPDCIPTTT